MHRVVFRCDAALLPEIGTGHVQRALRLADAIVAAGCAGHSNIGFLTRGDGSFSPGKRLLSVSPYERLSVTDAQLEPNSEAEGTTLCQTGAKLLIIDRLDTSVSLVCRAQEEGSRVVVFDDTSAGVRYADLAVNAILEAPAGVPNLLEGPEYLVMAAELPRPKLRNSVVEQVFACFGGHDARGLSRLLLEVLPKLGCAFHLDLVVGEIDSVEKARLQELLDGTKGTIPGLTGVLHQRPSDFYHLLARADIAVVAGGLMAFDAAAMGLPAVGLPQYDHQLATLTSLSARGALILGSDGMRISHSRLMKILTKIISDSRWREQMSLAGPRVVDGRGCERVVSALQRLMDRKATESSPCG